MRVLYAVRLLHYWILKAGIFFLPVFLFQLGSGSFGSELPSFLQRLASTEFQRGMLFVGGYFLLSRVPVALFSIPSVKFIQRVGLGRSMVIGHLMYVLTFASLLAVEQVWWMAPIAALFDGLHILFFWVPYHVLVVKNARLQHLGQDLGLIQFFVQLISAIAPAVAGLAIVILGYNSLFLLAVTLLLIMTALTFQLESIQIKDVVSFQECWQWIQKRQFQQQAAAFVGRYFNDATLAVWPLFVFLFLGDVTRVGYLYTAALLFSMVVSLFFGSYIDHHKKKNFFYLSGGVITVMWIARSFVTQVWGLLFVDSFERLSSNFYALFYDKQFVAAAKRLQPLSHFTYREFFISIGAVLFWSLFILIFMSTESWTPLFLLAAFGVIVSMYISDRMTLVSK